MTDEEYAPRNREKSKQAKYGWFWCNSCDRQLVLDARDILDVCDELENL